MDAYLAWGRSEGKYVDQHYSQYRAHIKAKIHALPIAELTPKPAFQSQGAAPENSCREYKAQKGHRKFQTRNRKAENTGWADREQYLLVHAFRYKPCCRHRYVERRQPALHQGRHLEDGKSQ